MRIISSSNRGRTSPLNIFLPNSYNSFSPAKFVSIKKDSIRLWNVSFINSFEIPNVSRISPNFVLID